MTNKTRLYLAVTIFLWASAFVGIRVGLQTYSPEGLALFRYLIASICMGLVYFTLPNRRRISFVDKLSLLGVGVLGIGIYNITLNYGELSISSGMASFIISQSPVITTLLAMLFLGEKMSFYRAAGILTSVIGVACITLGQYQDYAWDSSIIYILIATVAGGLYSLLQKPFLKKYHAIEVTTYIIWGATAFLSLYYSHLQHDFVHASLKSTLIVIYLGVFPAAIAYVAWSYVLSDIPASRAMSFIYITPFVATLLGWLCLGEAPVLLSLFGGMVAILGVWLVNQAFVRPQISLVTPREVQA